MDKRNWKNSDEEIILFHVEKGDSMVEFDNFEYLREHEIFTLEDLIGKDVFSVYPSQGIREEIVRRIEFGKKREWFFLCNSLNRVSELGNTIFLDYEEAHKYQLSKLEEYTQKQREKFLRKERETKIKELKELERLLEKYPDEESRKLPIKNTEEVTMKNVRCWFENDYENYDIREYDGHLEAMTDIAYYMIVEPHSGTDYKWMLRVTTRSAFDRWVNSTAIQEFFDSSIELCNYLYEHQLGIYKDLLKYLSLEYDEVTE